MSRHAYSLSMNVKRILVANDLLSYREAVAEVFRQLRPECEVFEVEVVNLNREILRLYPDLVICTQATSLVRERIFNWIELYPDCAPYSIVCLERQCSQIEDIQLTDLLSVVDRIEHHAHAN